MDEAVGAFGALGGGAESGCFAEGDEGGGFVPEGAWTTCVEEVEDFANDGCGGFDANEGVAALAIFISEPDADNEVGGPTDAPGVGVVVGGACFPGDVEGGVGKGAAEHV